jgi:hypothetical protein
MFLREQQHYQLATSEAKAQNLSYNLIDYAWYFRFTDGLAYVRVNNINNSSYTALDVDNNKVYSPAFVGVIKTSVCR